MTVGFWEEVLTKFDPNEPRDDRGRWASDAGNPHDPATWKGRGPLGPHWVSRIIPHEAGVMHQVQLDGKPVRCMSHGHCGSCGAAISVKRAGGYGHQTMGKPTDRYPVPGLKWNPVRDAPKPARKYDESEPRDDHGRWTASSGVSASDRLWKVGWSARIDTLDPPLQEKVVATLERLRNAFPMTRGAISVGPTGISLAVTRGSAITISDKLYSEGWTTKYPGILGPFKPYQYVWSSDPSFEGLITHEFAHVLDDQWANRGTAALRGGRGGFASGYAREGGAERFAEAFTQVMNVPSEKWSGDARKVAALPGMQSALTRAGITKSALIKYSESQPRDERGRWTDGGAANDPLGRWSGERFPPGGKGHHIMRENGTWGYSHAASQEITSVAAALMGVPGYTSPYETGRSMTLYHTTAAKPFLTAIANDRLGSEEPLYHGFENVNGTRFAVGDTLTLPTTATSGDASDSVGYGVRLDPADQRGTPTLFEFPQGTPMVGYSRWSVADQKDFGHIWSEAIVAGRFTVAGVREEHGVSHHWNDPLVQTVSLRPTETFDPATKAWRPVETSLLGG